MDLVIGRSVFTQYKASRPIGEFNDGESIVDAAGYISPKQRITNLLRAGERLDNFRREMYDYGRLDEDDGVWIDPLRSKGIDLSDISRIQTESLDRIRRRKPVAVKPTPEEQGALTKEATGDKGIEADKTGGSNEEVF